MYCNNELSVLLTYDKISFAAVVRADVGTLPRNVIVKYLLSFTRYNLLEQAIHPMIGSVLEYERERTVICVC